MKSQSVDSRFVQSGPEVHLVNMLILSGQEFIEALLGKGTKWGVLIIINVGLNAYIGGECMALVTNTNDVYLPKETYPWALEL